MIEINQIRDLPTLMLWRQEVLRHVFGEEPSAQLLKENRHYYMKHTEDGNHIALVASWDGTYAGCGALCFSEELPSPDNPNGKCAYLMNIYVREPYRQHGIAHAIVRQLLKEAKLRACGKIYLETTADGRPVYESLGFHDLPDIMKFYEDDKY